MQTFEDLSELLEADSRAMAFYNSLPMSTQQELYRRRVNTLEQLYGCADTREPIMNVASANEMTGAVTNGGDMTLGQWSDLMGMSGS